MTSTDHHTPTHPPAGPDPIRVPERHRPTEIAPDTWVIHATVGEGEGPVAVHMNSMVIRGAEPVVVDTGLPEHRHQYLEDLFSIVEPEDVRWVFITHEDADHAGNVDAVMAACPNATLVASWFLCQRLAGVLRDVPPVRWRWVGHGETFEAGDRTLAAVRPPLYDAPTTRGLFDTRTGVYWASDCYSTPVAQSTVYVEDLDPQFWADGFAAFQHWNSPWLSIADRGAFAAECRAIEDLRPSTIATCHGPTIEASHVATAFDLLRALPDVPVPPQPGQIVLDEIIASFAANASFAGSAS